MPRCATAARRARVQHRGFALRVAVARTRAQRLAELERRHVQEKQKIREEMLTQVQQTRQVRRSAAAAAAAAAGR